MSITIKDQPQTFSPVYNNNDWIVDSDNKANTSFRYVADIYVSGVTGFTRLKADADPSFGFGRFDVGRVIESFVNQEQLFDLDLTNHGFQRNAYTNMRYDIHFGEEYESGGTITVFPDLTTAIENYGFNSVKDFEDFVDYNQNDWLINTIMPLAMFLTNMPNPLTTYPDENRWVGMQYNSNTKADRLQVKTYPEADAGGSIIQTVKIDNAFVNPSNPFNRFVRVDIGDNLNAIDAGEISTGAQPIITTSVLSYTIQMINVVGALSSELRTINIDREQCSRFTNYTFHFLNKEGAFDTITLYLRSDRRATITKNTFRQPQGRLNSDGTFTYAKDQAGLVQIGSKIKDRIVVNSDWLTQAEKTWLEEFVTSPRILLLQDGELIAVNALNRAFERNKDENADVFNLVFEFEFGYSRTRQRY